MRADKVAAENFLVAGAVYNGNLACIVMGVGMVDEGDEFSIRTSTSTYLIGGFEYAGMLARAPQAGGAPRDIVEGVEYADWSPHETRQPILPKRKSQKRRPTRGMSKGLDSVLLGCAENSSPGRPSQAAE